MHCGLGKKKKKKQGVKTNLLNTLRNALVAVSQFLHVTWPATTYQLLIFKMPNEKQM